MTKTFSVVIVGKLLVQSENSVTDLEKLRRTVTDCKKCDLCKTRSTIVFGVGNPRASLMLLGEAPGKDEDWQGEPFVGRAGKLLNQWLEQDLQVLREETYITNICQCRPPSNRTPEEVEMQSCIPFLKEKIRIINPWIIITLGKTATTGLLSISEGISTLRGTWRSFDNVIVMPTYHPAFILRQPSAYILVQKDLQRVRFALDKINRNKGLDQ